MFPSAILLKADEEIFSKIRYYVMNNAKTRVEIQCVVGLKIALEDTNSRTLIIVDEADYCLLD